MQEGTFFGDIMDTGSLTNTGKPTVTGPVAHYCDGANFTPGTTGVVAGRLGANQSGAPYTNPYGTLCQDVKDAYGNYPNIGTYSNKSASCPAGTDMSKVDPSQQCPDGYGTMQFPYASTKGGSQVPWNYSITVWPLPPR